MRLRRRPSPLLLLLLPAFSTTFARSIPNGDASTKSPALARDTQPNPVFSESVIIPSGKPGPVGTQHAPVDGKDGKPHAGPFIETAAERDRKKAKEAGEEEAPLKPVSQPLKDALSPDGEKIPLTNDGVMDDPDRVGPKEGTTGTEGGVSERQRVGKLGEEKKPDPPKEVPPLPHSEEQRIPTKEKDAAKKEAEEKKLLEKPSDLPDKPHDIPIPNPLSSPDHLNIDKSSSTSKPTTPSSSTGEETNAIVSPLHSLVLSFTMILFSEIGDKTFLIAALMAMRHPRLVVFTAAFSALIAMTILSAVLGHAVPTLIPKTITSFLASALFLVFGVKMLLEAHGMSPDEGVSAEMKEVEMELEEKEHMQRRMSRRHPSITPYVLESGRGTRKARSSTSRLPSPPESPSSSSSRENSPSRTSTLTNAFIGINNLFSLLLSPAWVQTFVMTFLGEWGDRSQIATIAMAAGQDYWWVTGGAVSGHAICTAAAVIGGRAIAGRVSLRVVTLGGAIAFLVFGFIYLFEAIY